MEMILFTYSTAESYRKSFIATSSGQALHSHTFFCSWDFQISNSRSAKLKHENIYLELRSIVSDLYENNSFVSFWQSACAFVISTIIWILVVVAVGIIGSSIIFATELLKVGRNNGWDISNTYS